MLYDTTYDNKSTLVLLIAWYCQQQAISRANVDQIYGGIWWHLATMS